MSDRRNLSAIGHTLVELTVAVTVFTFALGGLYALLGRGTAYADHAVASLDANVSAHRSLMGLIDPITEASIDHIDTSARVFAPAYSMNYGSDRFQIPVSGLAQCSSPTCRFHTRPDLSTFADRYLCAHEYRMGSSNPIARGKVVPSSLTRCPFDGAPLVGTPTLDVLKIFSARRPNGSFATESGTNPEPEWRSILFFAPFGEDGSLPELRRYDVAVEDLLVNPPTVTGTWTLFPPASPSLIQLLDFGADGTTNGIRDGRLGVTTATSDATIEYFGVGYMGSDPCLVYWKEYRGATTYPYRNTWVSVRLKDGYTQFQVQLRESSTLAWYASRNYTREPQVVARNVTEFAVSTKDSAPYDAVTNPTGVDDERLVRITLGTSRKSLANGGETWSHTVDTFTLSPRNRP